MLTSIKNLYLRAVQLVARISWLGPLAARVVIGLVFVFSGWGKLHNLDNVTEFFTSLHIPMPHANAVFVSSVELVGGLLLIVGLGTRIAALFLIGVMAVAILTAIYPEGDAEVVLLSKELGYLLIFIWLTVAGPGPVSIDHAVARRTGADLAVR